MYHWGYMHGKLGYIIERPYGAIIKTSELEAKKVVNAIFAPLLEQLRSQMLGTIVPTYLSGTYAEFLHEDTMYHGMIRIHLINGTVEVMSRDDSEWTPERFKVNV